MVESIYWGRSATGKRPLTDQEIARLMREREHRADRFDMDLADMDVNMDPLLPAQRARGRLYVMAQPTSPPSVKVSDAIGNKRIIDIVRGIRRAPKPQWTPSFEGLGYEIGHPDGRAAATEAPANWDTRLEENLGWLLLRDDATVQYISGNAFRAQSGDTPPRILLPGVCETLHQVASFTSHLSTEYLNYAGSWRLGLRITGLRGLLPSQAFHEAGGEYAFNPFQTDTYQRSAVVSVEQLRDPSSTVVETVAADFARGLKLHRRAFPYTDLADMGRKLGAR